MEIFNNREIALFLWTIAVLLWVSRNSEVRNSFKTLIKTGFVPRLTSLWFTYLGYVAVLVYVLEQLGVWGLPHLKTTIYWTLTAGLLAIWRAVGAEEFREYLKDFVRDNFKLVIAIEFVVAFYSFGLFTELGLVLIATVLAMMIAFVQDKEEYRQVRIFIETLFTTLGLAVTVHAFYQLYIYFEEFAQPGTLVEFALPPILSTLLLPFVYVLYLVARYETVVQKVDRHIGKSRRLRRYAKLKALLHLHVRIPLLNQWASSLGYNQVESKEEVDKTIEEHLKMHRREKCPPAIEEGEGWSPYHAKEFLRDHGLRTGYYHPIPGHEWYAGSNDLRLGDGPLTNTISYHVSGTESAAQLLKLDLNTFWPESEKSARVEFRELVVELVKRALGRALPDEIAAAIDSKGSREIVIEGKCVSVETAHRGTMNTGYLMSFEVRHTDADSTQRGGCNNGE